MDFTSCDKKIVMGLIEILMTGVKNDNLDQADALLAALRILRPNFGELDIFDAWLLIKRKKHMQAAHILRGMVSGEQTTKNMSICTALLSLCLHHSGDPTWEVSANEVLARDDDAEAVGLVNMLCGKHVEDAEPKAAADAPAAPPDPALDLNFSYYMRA
ncbi:MAG TPA: HrpB1 family type III secretion system apparatus protein [Burkholderiaceae bacterium]